MTDTAPITPRALLSRFDAPKKIRGGWMVKCPAHPDGTASLKISEGEDGKALLHCHAGCDWRAVLAALGLPPEALSGASGDGASRPADVKPAGEDYDYEAEDGTVLFRVSRWYRKGKDGAWSKSFVQKRKTADGFENGMDGVDRVPYNLPAVRAAVAVGQPVYVVEGEKDVHTLRQWGLVGTCNPGGAGKWADAFGRYLAGADVVVLPDNDEPGRRHASDVVASARKHAASVVVVDLPGLQEKGDLTDWVRLGHTADELRGLVARQRDAGEVEIADLGPIRRPLVGRATMDPAALRNLPAMLRELVGHYPKGERDVALTAAVSVLSGLMPNARVAHYDKDYGLHLMFCLVARSGGGKGVLDQCARLADVADASIREDFDARLKQWEEIRLTRKKGDTDDLGPKPFPTGALIPANASKSFILRAVDAAGETALMVETEIDTLVSANGQEWGDFSDLIRKAFHHEPYRMGRIGSGGGESLTIERPSLALALSGTWGQFERLFADNVDNGFFNRFLFLVSTAERAYRSSRPSPQSWGREHWFKGASLAVSEIQDALAGRQRPLVVGMTEGDWDRLDALFAPAYERAGDHSMRERALPFVQRASLVALRLVGVLTILRAWEHRVDIGGLAGTASLTATALDVSLALHIASVWFDHGMALLTHLSPEERQSPLVSLKPEARAVFDALPETFKRADADEAGAGEGVTARTVKRYLKQYQGAGLISRDGHTYTKIASGDESVAFDAEAGAET